MVLDTAKVEQETMVLVTDREEQQGGGGAHGVSNR